MNKISSLFFVLLSIQLVSCGSSSDNSTGSSQSPRETYTGNVSRATLTEINTPIYTRLLLGSDFSRNSAAYNLTALREDVSDILKHLALLEGNSPPTSNVGEWNLSSNPTHCTHGGNHTEEGRISSPDYTGTISYTFSNCQISGDITYHGKASITSFSYNFPRSSVINYENLSLTINGITYNIVGSVDSSAIYEDDSKDVYVKTRIRNLSISSPDLNFSALLEDFSTIMTVTYSEDTVSTDISGRVYLHDDGFISLSNSSNYVYEGLFGIPSITQFGDIYLSGQNSSAKLRRIDIIESGNNYFDGNTYRVDIDTDGDGIYELTTLDKYHEVSGASFYENQAPSPQIRYASNDFRYRYCYSQEDQFLSLNRVVYLKSVCSDDADNDSLTFDWKILSKPERSSTTLNEPRESENNSFNIDARGTYQISLTTADTDGSGKSNTSIVEIVIDNNSPSVSIENREELYEVSLGQTVEFKIKAYDQDTIFTDTNDMDIQVTYKWNSKPEGSISNPELVHSAKSGNSGDYGLSLEQRYTFTPDKKGVHYIQFLAKDFEGAEGGWGLDVGAIIFSVE